MKQPAVPLSLCMIVKNEARTLARCLDSVRGLAAECVVIDTGSTDNTLALAREYSAKTAAFDFSFIDFAAARNHALNLASGRWIVVLDADETLAPESLSVIQALIANNENAGYYFERVNHSAGQQEFTTDYAVRLFPNRAEYRYHGRVHETIDDSILAAGGKLHRTGVRIHHDFSPDPEARRRKNLQYIEILHQEIAANPQDTSRLDFLAAEYHQLGLFDRAAETAECIALMRPLDPSAHLNAALYHLLFIPNYPRASHYLHRALELNPAYPEALSFLRVLNQRSASV